MPGMKKTLDEFKSGTLHSGSKTGPKVTSRKQAIAIGLNDQGKGTPVGKGSDVGVGAAKKKAAPKALQRKSAPKMIAAPPMNPNATGMAQIPYGQQVVPRPAGMTSLGIGGDTLSGARLRARKARPMLDATPQLPATPTSVRNIGGMGGELSSGGTRKIGVGSSSTTGHVRQPNPLLAARRPNRAMGKGMMKLGTGSDAAEDRKMTPKQLKADISEDKTILKGKLGKGSAASKEERTERKRGIPEGKTLGGKAEPPDDKKVGRRTSKKTN